MVVGLRYAAKLLAGGDLMQPNLLKRRDLITLLGSAAAAWPLAAHGQQAERVRRIGVLLPATADESQFQAWVGSFLQELTLLGWSIGDNVRIDTRWATANATEVRRHAAELAALSPDVILAHGASSVLALLPVTSSVPIVFPVALDPVGAGIVDSLARPGGNVTGFGGFEYGLGSKWVEHLREIAPGMVRMAVLRDPANPGGPALFGIIQAVATSLKVEVTPVNMRDADEIERAVSALARSSPVGLIITPNPFATVHRDLIIALAARHSLPSVYYDRSFVAAGGLMSYGPDFLDLYRRAASYVDRILKGEKPRDLPVQAPVKYETVLNLKTAKALGLAIPEMMLVRADEVIE
jgi:putative ABC transport system substrate-binding protein